MVMAAAGALDPPEKDADKLGVQMTQIGSSGYPQAMQPPKLITQQSRTLMYMVKRGHRSKKYINELDPSSGEPMLYKCARSGFYQS